MQERRFWRVSFQYSGGMRPTDCYRYCSCRPDILICDEPTTALDVTIQAQIIGFKIIAERMPLYNYIYHHLAWVLLLALPIKVAVMYAGEIVGRYDHAILIHGAVI